MCKPEALVRRPEPAMLSLEGPQQRKRGVEEGPLFPKEGERACGENLEGHRQPVWGRRGEQVRFAGDAGTRPRPLAWSPCGQRPRPRRLRRLSGVVEQRSRPQNPWPLVGGPRPYAFTLQPSKRPPAGPETPQGRLAQAWIQPGHQATGARAASWVVGQALVVWTGLHIRGPSAAQARARRADHSRYKR